MLSLTREAPAFYERQFVWLFWLNLAVAALLSLVILLTALRLAVRKRQGKFGSNLLIRLAGIFALVGVLPGALIYTVSYQFVSRGIESWFDVKVEGALDAGLSLGRGMLDAQLAGRGQMIRHRVAEDLKAAAHAAATWTSIRPGTILGRPIWAAGHAVQRALRRPGVHREQRDDEVDRVLGLELGADDQLETDESDRQRGGRGGDYL